MRGSSCWCVRLCTKYFYSSLDFFYGRRPGQPSSSSLARRVCVHFEYVFADAQNYVKSPGSSCEAEGRWRDSAAGGHSPFRDPVCSQSAPCNLTFFLLKDVFNNLPVGQRLWRPELYVPSFVRGTQPGWRRTSSRPSMRGLFMACSLSRVCSPSWCSVWVLASEARTTHLQLLRSGLPNSRIPRPVRLFLRASCVYSLRHLH